ncbi:MAG TPA: VTT domain-containing protein [Bryobacteraceae bacterium]|jgi:membrane protein DedA with SNARE-associated domain|nr:VTT domain-containing protein [Bryobacteraceae bacterium]
MIRSLLLKHGYSFLFGYILGVTAGIPIPADPLLLAMGAMAGDGRYSMPLSLLTAAAAALIADWIWYEVGRLRGRAVLALLCRFALEPDSCVRSTEINFRRRGPRALLFAKFVPGMSLVAMPLAGTIRMPRWRFLLGDATGVVLWALTWLVAGFVFHRQVDTVIAWLGLLGTRAGVTVAILIALYLGVKYFQRWRFLRQVRVNRITPQEAAALIESGAPVTILDLRHSADVAREGVKVAGALVVAPEDLRSRSHEIPDDQEIILYCT